MGYQTVEQTSAREALKQMRFHVFDVIVLNEFFDTEGLEDSPVLEQLRHLEEAGVEIAACGTCLSRLGLMDRVVVGKKSDMRSTVNALTEAQKVVSV